MLRVSRWTSPACTYLVALGVFVTVLFPGASRAAVVPTEGPAKPPTATFGLGPSGVSKLDGRPYFNYVVSPGARVEDHVAVVNLSARSQTFGLYVTDAANALDGSFTYPVASSKPTDAGGWMSVRTGGLTSTVIIPPRSTRIFPIVVAVPPGASPGDHAAAVIVSLTASSSRPAGERINLDQRVAVRTFFRVSGPLRPGLTVERLRSSFQGGGLSSGYAVLSYRIRNSGNVKLGGRQRLRVRGVFSGSTQQGVTVPVLIPGGVVEMQSKIGRVVPQFRMTARVTVTALGVTGDAVPLTPDAVATIHFWAVPWIWLLVLPVMVALIFIGRRWRRRRRTASTVAGERPTGVTAPKHDVTVRLAAVVSMAVLGVAGAASGAGATDQLPYADGAVTGSIGLCDVQGHNVTSGKITDKPFVWLAVGTTAAPPSYAAPGRTAFLTAFQPRQGVAPGDWSGTLLTAASRYTNPEHPMSQATPISSTLTDFLGRYPPQWNGLVQLRLLLGGSNRSPRTDTYDATDLRVTGDTWRVVRGGTGPCRAGAAVNTAVLLKVPGAQGLPKPGAVAILPPVDPPAPSQVAAGRDSPAGSQTVTQAPQGPASPGAQSLSRPTTAPNASSESTTGLPLGIGVVFVVSALLMTYAIRRRRAF